MYQMSFDAMSANALNGLERVAAGNSATQLTRDMGHLRWTGGMARCRSHGLAPTSPNDALAPQNIWDCRHAIDINGASDGT